MKLVILAAGKSSSIAGIDEAPPVCLQQFDESATVLDTLIAVGAEAGVDETIIVGGYHALDIMAAYPGPKFFYNEDWTKTGAVFSLMRAASEFDDDLLIAYSDVVHERTIAFEMLKQQADVVLAYDSVWKTRYEGRTSGALERAEVVTETATGSFRIIREETRLQSAEKQAKVLGEFAGLLLLRRPIVQRLVNLSLPLLQDYPRSEIGSLVALLGTRSRIAAIDLRGRWAELDTEADLARFRFGTKAETLTRLEGVLEHGVILPQTMIRVSDWRSAQAQVIDSVSNTFFESRHVVVRSSAVNEDTHTESMAGNFTSVLDVPVSDTNSLAAAIECVIESYRKNGAPEIAENQVLVQPMLRDVTAAGVVFTEDIETGAPYYTISFDESGSTESITSGSDVEHRTLILARNLSASFDEPVISRVLAVVQEIEQLTGYHALDIEFAVCRSDSADAQPEVFVLQVRPITAQKEQLRVAADDVEGELESIASYIQSDRSRSTVLCGRETAYGVMPDWNPAEIIGINPRPLAFSLYRHLITDWVWGHSRQECGYRATHPKPGLVSFAGKPYVDVRMSFSSFVPATMSDDTAEQLVEYAVIQLRNKPELHDKVEFEIMPTAFDLDFQSQLDKLNRCGFDSRQCQEIADAYRNLTNQIIKGTAISVDGELRRVELLERGRQAILADLKFQPAELAMAIDMLLDQCRRNGSLPFSNLARLAFIGVIQLKALVRRGILTQDRYDEFMASIQTVAKQFVHDLAFKNQTELLAAYGHLRPGTYDITSLAYGEAFDQYIDLSHRPTPEPQTDFSLTAAEATAIEKSLTDNRIDVNADELLDFVRSAVQARELGKFEFTKNLSAAIDLMVKMGETFGIDRSELSFLEIHEITDLKSKSVPVNHAAVWHERIERRRRMHTVTAAIKLPELICTEQDIYSFSIAASKPNFITQKSVVASVASVQNVDANLDGAICLIEHADPGFDWIFSHEIGGLVTAFGGANSHMAIRCAEFGIPAAIGCGESHFRQLERANRIRLDCASNTIEVVS